MADRYWVGGTANWDGTAGTKWATTSGGAGGASVPTAADDVFFDAASGTVTCTIATGNNGAKSINFTGFTGTFAGSTSLALYGSVTLATGMTYTNTGTISFFANATITTAGKTFSPITVNGSGITVELGDALTSSGAVTVTAGTFTTNNFNVTATFLSSTNSNARTINLGSSVVTFTNATGFSATTSTNLTLNAGTSQINLTAQNSEIRADSLTFYNVSFTSTLASTHSVFGLSKTFNNLSIAGPASNGVAQVTFNANQTINGTLSTTGTAGNKRVWFRSSTYGVRQTLTVNSAPSLTDADFRDIIVNGTAAPISGTRIGNRGACAGITFSTPKTVYWVGSAGGDWGENGRWATTSGGATSNDNFPLPQDTAIIENTGLATSSTIQLNQNVLGYVPNVDCSTRTNAMTFNVGVTTVYGSWTNGSGVSFTGTSTLTFSGEGTKTITSAGKTFSCPIAIDAYGGTVELADALNIGSQTLTVTNGTFDTKNYNVTAGSLSSSNSNVRFISLGSSTVTLSSSTAIQLSTSTNLTFNAGTSQINPTFAQFGSGATINATNITFNNVAFASTAASTNLTHTLGGSGGNTFNNLSMNTVAAGLSKLVVTGNQTINGTLTCTSANNVSRCMIQSATFGTPVTLTVASISAPSTNFRDITLAGSAAGFAPTYGGDCGGNSGIVFPSPKSVYWNLAGSQQFTANGWASTSGGTPNLNNYPLPQDTAVFDDTGAVGTVTCGDGTGAQLPAIDLSARTSAMTFAFYLNGGHECYGGFTNSSSGSVSVTAGSGANVYRNRGTQTFTSAGKTITFPITVDSFSGTFQLGDALNSSNTITLGSGTLDAVTYNVTCTAFATSGAVARTLKMGSGLWTLTGTGSIWNISTITLEQGTADILLSSTSTAARTFTGDARSYNKLTIGGATGTSTTTISGNNQFTELASTKTVAHTIDLGTTTQTFGKWTVTGSAGNVVTLSGTGTSHVLAGSCTSGIDYLAMGSIGFAATSPAEFYAGANSTGTAGAPVYRTAKPADSTRYWVGGTGNWSDTARWSTSSGGASGASVPRSHDDVVFDSASNATAYTATVNAVTGGIRCKALTIAGPASGNVTLAGSVAIDGIHGDVTLPATGMTRTYTGAITLSGSTTGKTFTTNGVGLSGNTTINGVGCGWTLGSAYSGGSVVVTNGSFDTGNFNVTAGALSSNNTNTRSITLGSSTVSLSTSIFSVDLRNNANLILDAGTSTFNLTATTAPGIYSTLPITLYDVVVPANSISLFQIVAPCTFNNLTVNAFTSTPFRTVELAFDIVVNGTLTVSAGANATNRQFVRSNVIGTTRTLTCNAVASLTDIDFRDITIAGSAAPVSGTRLGDCKGNSGITFDASKTVYWNLAGNNNWSATAWATSAGGTVNINNFPLAQDTAIFTSTSPASGATTTINAGYNIGTIDMSARTANTMTLTVSTSSPTIYGDLINGTGTNPSGTATFTFAGRGSQTITSAGKTFTQAFNINSPNGSVTLQDALVTSNTAGAPVTLTSGTFDSNGYNVSFTSSGTVTGFVSTGDSARTLAIGSSTWSIAQPSASWTISGTNVAITGTGTISLLASTKTFAGGGLSYSGITLDQAGTGTLTITGNNTFANITNTAAGATTIALGTTTQRVANFTATGTVGNVLTITGTTSNLIYTGGGSISGIDYLNVQGRVYGPNGETSGIWYAGANSTNSGSLGWEFTSGSITYNVVITENATLADVVSGVVTFEVQITENSEIADVVGGVKTLFVSASEGTTLAELQDFVNLILVSITEGVVSAELQDALTVFNRTATENINSADSTTATGIFSAILVENATIADTATAQAIFNTLRAEGFTSANIQTASNVIARSLTEGQSVADVQNGVRALAASITENLVSEEAESALKVLVSSIAENLSSAEAQTTQVNFNADRVEPVTSADIAAAQANFNSAVAEASTLADILDAIRVLADTVTENSDVADSQDRLAIFFAIDTEGLVIQDLQAAQANFNSIAAENIVLSDQLVGYGWFRVVDDQTVVWTNINNTQSITWTNIGNDQDPNWVQINDSQP